MTDEPREDGTRINAGLDAAVHCQAEDRYGFTHIAKQLALAIEGLWRDGSAVIGIEGSGVQVKPACSIYCVLPSGPDCARRTATSAHQAKWDS